METQTTEAATAQPTETLKPEATNTATPKTQPDKGGDEVGSRIQKLLDKEKDPGYQHSDEDLDFLETEYYSGKNKPSKPREVEREEPEEGESEAEPEGDVEENEEEPKEPKKAKISKEIEDAMKEVGAKSPEELAGKIKELRKQLSGKDAQAVATLSKEKQALEQKVNAEVALIEDLKKGVPEAIQHFERAYGLKVVQPGQQTQTQEAERPFSDEDDALVGGALSKAWDRIAQLEKTVGGVQSTYQQEQQRLRDQAAGDAAKAATIDEIWTVSQFLPELKDIPNLRGLVNDWVKSGNEDPRLAPLNELFDIATKEGVSLTVAHKMKKADDAERLIAEAEARGRASAYKHKPNPSLSGITGGKGETTHYSDDQMSEMLSDHSKHPADWYDKDDNLIPSRIPAKWRSRFGF